MRSDVLTLLLTTAVVALVGLAAGTGCSADDCSDEDGDGFFGASPNCSNGRDCDDTRAAVSPEADEVCDNSRDDDCDGTVDECGSGPTADVASDTDAAYGRVDGDTGGSTDGDARGCSPETGTCGMGCTDADGDGWGVDGSEACVEEGSDCNDGAPKVHPGAEETCNGQDDDCDGDTDECDTQGASCSQKNGTMRCLTSVGGRCNSSKVCPAHAKCDGGVNPNECRKIRGEPCNGTSECRSSLTCSDGRCSGNYCSMHSCGGDRPICDDKSRSCVECRYWYSDAVGTLPDCMAQEGCLGDGVCGRTVNIDDASHVPPYPSITRDVLDVARELAECWGRLEGGDTEMCVGFQTTGVLSDPITEQEIRTAYQELKNAKTNNNLQNFSNKNFGRLKDLVGDGLGNDDDLNWKSDLPPNSNYEVCTWFHSHTLLDELHVDNCDAFAW